MRKRPVPPQPKTERSVTVQGEYITLGQLLKVAGILGTGGEAKFYLSEQVVQVNGEPEQRRGRKLRPGDLVIPPGEAPIRLRAGKPSSEREMDADDV